VYRDHHDEPISLMQHRWLTRVMPRVLAHVEVPGWGYVTTSWWGTASIPWRTEWRLLSGQHGARVHSDRVSALVGHRAVFAAIADGREPPGSAPRGAPFRTTHRQHNAETPVHAVTQRRVGVPKLGAI